MPDDRSVSRDDLIRNQGRLVDKLQCALLGMEGAVDLRDVREGVAALSMAIDKLASLQSLVR
jgi:hypothetical protein